MPPVADDPQFVHRMPLLPVDEVGAEQLPLPIFIEGEELPRPTMAPTIGEHTDEVMTAVLGYDADAIAELRVNGAFGDRR